MCGRFVSKESKEKLAEYFSATKVTPQFHAPSHNVAPTESVPVVMEDAAGERSIELAQFGMPMMVKGKRFPLINLQSEKAGKREDFNTRRCLVPAAGFYEWEKVGKEKLPHYFSEKDGLLALAGVYRIDKAGLAFAILTTRANKLLEPIHTRMPVILGHNAASQWLDAKTDHENLVALMEPYPAQRMQEWRVSKAVNTPKNKDAACINSL